MMRAALLALLLAGYAGAQERPAVPIQSSFSGCSPNVVNLGGGPVTIRFSGNACGGAETATVRRLEAFLMQAQSQVENRAITLSEIVGRTYDLLYRMPKGADLHTHLEGAVYAEDILSAAIEQHLCLNRQSMSIWSPPCRPDAITETIDVSQTLRDAVLRNSVIDSFSMRNFVPGSQTSNNHFYDTFSKFGAVSLDGLVSEVARRAAAQNESYLELMALVGGSQVYELGEMVGFDSDFDSERKKLEEAGLRKVVASISTRVDRMEQTRIKNLHCDEKPQSNECRLRVRYIYQVLRGFPREAVFVDILTGFMLASQDERVAGVTIVQPEDLAGALSDYYLQMKMFEYAKTVFPAVRVTLSAGEIYPGLVPPEDVRFHIRQAVEVAGADRIGNGVDVVFEEQPRALLALMRRKRTLVEINLASNDAVLGVHGDDHPLPVYLANHVPVALCTDDEGILRTDLTQQFLRAVVTYGLTYPQVKTLVRNSLEYSFLAGASYWKDDHYTNPNESCMSGVRTERCKAFLASSEKARLQQDLEDRFAAFEASNNKH
jgi:adenosine deaminase